MVIHAIKHIAGISEKIKLLPPFITDSVKNLKTEILSFRFMEGPSLHSGLKG